MCRCGGLCAGVVGLCVLCLYGCVHATFPSLGEAHVNHLRPGEAREVWFCCYPSRGTDKVLESEGPRGGCGILRVGTVRLLVTLCGVGVWESRRRHTQYTNTYM